MVVIDFLPPHHNLPKVNKEQEDEIAVEEIEHRCLSCRVLQETKEL